MFKRAWWRRPVELANQIPDLRRAVADEVKCYRERMTRPQLKQLEDQGIHARFSNCLASRGHLISHRKRVASESTSAEHADNARQSVATGAITERRLAQLAGWSQPQAANVLGGRRTCAPALADAIVRILGITVLDLYTLAEFRAIIEASAETARARLESELDLAPQTRTLQ